MNPVLWICVAGVGSIFINLLMASAMWDQKPSPLRDIRDNGFYTGLLGSTLICCTALCIMQQAGLLK